MYKIISSILDEKLNSSPIFIMIKALAESNLEKLNELLESEPVLPTIETHFQFPFSGDDKNTSKIVDVFPNNSLLNFAMSFETKQRLLDHAKETKQLHKMGLFQETGSFSGILPSLDFTLRSSDKFTDEQKVLLLAPILSIYSDDTVEATLMLIEGITKELIDQAKEFIKGEGAYIKDNISLHCTLRVEDLSRYIDTDLAKANNPVNQHAKHALTNGTLDQDSFLRMHQLTLTEFIKSLPEIPGKLYTSPTDAEGTTVAHYLALSKKYDLLDIALATTNCLQFTTSIKQHVLLDPTSKTAPLRMFIADKNSNLFNLTLLNEPVFLKVVAHAKEHNDLSKLFVKRQLNNNTYADCLVTLIFINKNTANSTWTDTGLAKILDELKPAVDDMPISERIEFTDRLRANNTTYTTLFDEKGYVITQEDLNVQKDEKLTKEMAENEVKINALNIDRSEDSKARTLALAESKKKNNPLKLKTQTGKDAIVLHLLINGHFDTVKTLGDKGSPAFQSKALHTNSETTLSPLFQLLYMHDRVSSEEKIHYKNALKFVLEDCNEFPVETKVTAAHSVIVEPKELIMTFQNTTLLHGAIESKDLFELVLETAAQKKQLHRVILNGINGGPTEAIKNTFQIAKNLDLNRRQVDLLLAPIVAQNANTDLDTLAIINKTALSEDFKDTFTGEIEKILEEESYLIGQLPNQYEFSHINENPDWYFDTIHAATQHGMTDNLFFTNEEEVPPLFIFAEGIIQPDSKWTAAHLDKLLDIISNLRQITDQKIIDKCATMLIVIAKQNPDSKNELMKIIDALLSPQQKTLLKMLDYTKFKNKDAITLLKDTQNKRAVIGNLSLYTQLVAQNKGINKDLQLARLDSLQTELATSTNDKNLFSIEDAAQTNTPPKGIATKATKKNTTKTHKKTKTEHEREKAKAELETKNKEREAARTKELEDDMAALALANYNAYEQDDTPEVEVNRRDSKQATEKPAKPVKKQGPNKSAIQTSTTIAANKSTQVLLSPEKRLENFIVNKQTAQAKSFIQRAPNKVDLIQKCVTSNFDQNWVYSSSEIRGYVSTLEILCKELNVSFPPVPEEGTRRLTKQETKTS
jgi:hypothetical protein